MTYLVGGAVVGIGVFAAFWFLARKTLSFPVINPALVKWDNGTSTYT